MISTWVLKLALITAVQPIPGLPTNCVFLNSACPAPGVFSLPEPARIGAEFSLCCSASICGCSAGETSVFAIAPDGPSSARALALEVSAFSRAGDVCVMSARLSEPCPNAAECLLKGMRREAMEELAAENAALFAGGEPSTGSRCRSFHSLGVNINNGIESQANVGNGSPSETRALTTPVIAEAEQTGRCGTIATSVNALGSFFILLIVGIILGAIRRRSVN